MKNKRQKVQRINDRLEQFYGVPGMKAAHADPMRSLVLTILSQNTSDANSFKAFADMEREYPAPEGGIDWDRVANAPADQLARVIRTGGLANQKSERIQNILRWIQREYGAYRLDALADMDPDAAIALFTRHKGIGIKTIAVVLAFSSGADIFPVDTHVHRVCRRLGLVDEKSSAEKTFYAMRPLIPEGKGIPLHMNFIRLGREICRARGPACAECPLSGLCDFAGGRQ